MAEGFLSRWSRRKAGIDEGLKEEGPPKQATISTQVTAPVESQPQGETQEGEAPAPATLEDVEKIDRFAADFSAFMKPGVDPVVQQAALKKMFTDPHFNIMDGLDIYIDDYSKPDPLPPGMLERMVQSDMLNLFRKNEEDSGKTNQQVDGATILNGPSSEASHPSDLTSNQSQVQTPSVNLDEIPIDMDKKEA